MNAEVTSSDEHGGFSRRRVVKGVAWSVPVIVTAIAAPAAAASGINAAAALVGPACVGIFEDSAGRLALQVEGLLASREAQRLNEIPGSAEQ